MLPHSTLVPAYGRRATESGLRPTTPTLDRRPFGGRVKLRRLGRARTGHREETRRTVHRRPSW